MNYTIESTAVLIAGACWLVGCIILAVGFWKRRPDIYATDAVSFPALTEARVVQVHGEATLPKLRDIHTMMVNGGSVNIAAPEGDEIFTIHDGAIGPVADTTEESSAGKIVTNLMGPGRKVPGSGG